MAFNPKINTAIQILGETYRFTAHPSAKGVVYGQAGRRATVYQVENGSGQLFALKVFKAAFRTPDVRQGSIQIAAYCGLPGLRACQRMVLTSPNRFAVLKEYPELTYAVLMPWIQGSTWQEILIERAPLTQQQSWEAASRLANVLAAMEARGLAHSDLSAPNVLVDVDNRQVMLVDLEEMYGPGFHRPAALNAGSEGYAHIESKNGSWGPAADRFTGGLIMAEMLGISSESFRGLLDGESAFLSEELQTECERYAVLQQALDESWGAVVGDLFRQMWFSAALLDCPTFTDWKTALEIQGERFGCLSEQSEPQQTVFAAQAPQLVENTEEAATYPALTPANPPAVGNHRGSAARSPLRAELAPAPAGAAEPMSTGLKAAHGPFGEWVSLLEPDQDRQQTALPPVESAPSAGLSAFAQPVRIDAEAFQRARSIEITGPSGVPWGAVLAELLLTGLLAALAALALRRHITLTTQPLTALYFALDCGLTALLTGAAQAWIFHTQVTGARRLTLVFSCMAAGLIGGAALGWTFPQIANAGDAFLAGAGIGAVAGGAAAVLQNVFVRRGGSSAAWFLYCLFCGAAIWGAGWTLRWWIGGMAGAVLGEVLIVVLTALPLFLLSRLSPETAPA